MGAALRRADHDLEAVEQAIRCAVLAAGAEMLGKFMSAVGKAQPKTPVLCPHCHRRMRGTGPRRRNMVSLLGPTAYTRARYDCPFCQKSVRYPADEALDVVGTSRSPGLRRQTARLGSKETFQEVAQDLAELAGVQLSRKDAERIAEAVGHDIDTWDQRQRERQRFAPAPAPETPKTMETLYIEMDGTGIPVVPRELEGRKGKQADGSAKTREAKLGCVFTQTTLDEEGRPVRDPASTTFTGAIEETALFGWRIYAEALRRGLYGAKRVVVLADAAEWIKKLVELHFPMAIRIIDFYHAKEHLNHLCQDLFYKPERVAHYRERWWGLLAQGHIESILAEAGPLLSKDPNGDRSARRELAYLDGNKEQMRYRAFREQGLFIGSGVIEAGCKNVIGKRLKQSGMEWTVEGANKIIALRCVTLSGRFNEYWEQRVA
ncbi:MAG: ISKra4 family transposase [Candidatus Hydrogenedentes bacterium]|nr:ISKra4 family transposase [Candidatus Hydrogenedentota bacterium]